MIDFKIKEHTYGAGRYTSVTTLLSKYKSFDIKKVSEAYAKKHPEKSAAQWRATWKKIGKEAGDWGTKVHKKKEDATKLAKDCRVASVNVDGNTIRSLKSLVNLEDGVYPELIIWSDLYRAAGQVDLVRVRGKEVELLDYKTYKRVELRSFYNPRTKERTMMKEPLHGVEDCTLNHAGLQMAIYGKMLEDIGYKVTKMVMMHIDRNGKETPYRLKYSTYDFFAGLILYGGK